QALGGEPSEAALDRALGELWSRLRITRVDYRAGEGALWDTLLRWAPEAVREGLQLSVGEALSALISRYLEAVVAAERKQIEEFFSLLAPRSRVRENVNALLAARELAFRSVGSTTLVELAPLRAAEPRAVATEKP
ncbi:MAG TPA: crosslink repair DNA glycosylase YcaQ family protein, partial [Terriglobales bacterium]|nr:crosslink repair DNA glycosylase YcaQ family protein [Terriglobales bacterium]